MGITISLDNKQISNDGTHYSDSVGSFDYGIILNQADTEVNLKGTITVENNTKQTLNLGLNLKDTFHIKWY